MAIFTRPSKVILGLNIAIIQQNIVLLLISLYLLVADDITFTF